jgi:hypothetical protein
MSPGQDVVRAKFESDWNQTVPGILQSLLLVLNSDQKRLRVAVKIFAHCFKVMTPTF